MPRKKTGHVEARNGRYRARYGRAVLGTFATERDALEAIAAEQLLDRGRAIDTFAVRGEKYMREQELQHRQRRGNTRMFEKEWSDWDRHIRSSKLYKMPVKQIRREHVQELLDSIVGAPALQIKPQPGGGILKVPSGKLIGQRTAYKVRGRLTHFFDTCLDLAGNPAARCKIKNVRRIAIRKDGDRKPHLHIDEIERLFALPELTDEHRAVYALGIYAGLRVDEIVGLRWENIVRLNGDSPELHIRYSYSAPTKTEGSQREIPMLDPLVNALRRYRATFKIPPVTGVVFPGDPGKSDRTRSPGYSARWTDKPYTNDSGKRVVRIGYRSLAKIRDHIQFRHIRHTCGTHLLKGTFTNGHEWPIEKVSEILGHDSVATTIKHYVSRDVDRLHAEVGKGRRRGEREARQAERAGSDDRKVRRLRTPETE